MYIDNLTITAFIVVAIAVVMFVRKCIINSCMMSPDKSRTITHDVEADGEQ
jgi:hypothetical protein